MPQPALNADLRDHFENLYNTSDPWRYEGTDPDIVRTNAIVKRLQHARFAYGLDLGCGEGRLTNALSGFTKRMLGVDIAERALERARARYPHVDFTQGELIEFLERPGADHSAFDFVSASEVLYYYQSIEERRKALARLAAIGVPTCVYYFAAIVQTSSGPRRYFDLDELTSLVSERFTIVDCFPSVVEMPRYLEVLSRYMLPRAARIKLREMYAATRDPRHCEAVGLLAVKRQPAESVKTSITILRGIEHTVVRAQPAASGIPLPNPGILA